jgi:Xaa-Pro aminopeptidase
VSGPVAVPRRRGAFAPALLAARRQRVLQALEGGVAVLPTAPVHVYSRDVDYPFRPDSDFLHLTGFREPEAVAILTPRSRQGAFWLLVRPRDPDKEIWTGRRAGPAAAAVQSGADVARPIAELDRVLDRLLATAPYVWQMRGINPSVDAAVARALRRVRARGRRPVRRDLSSLLHPLRLIKDGAEIATLRAAARIACEAHRAAMRATAPGRMEHEIEAIVEYQFRRRGAAGPGYPTIVASGRNACILHYTDNAARLRAGDLLLLDAGCELDGYNSDVTRTFPISGHFTVRQRELYDLVLAANQAAIAAVHPGAPFDAPHRAALGLLADGLVGLGMLRGSPAEAIESGEIRRFFMHRTSHWLGLDVHDVGSQVVDGEPRRLEAGMVLTVEPGVYVAPRDARAPGRWRGLGIRIEDDVLVTRDGREVLTRSAPKRAADIEAAMSISRRTSRRSAPLVEPRDS